MSAEKAREKARDFGDFRSITEPGVENRSSYMAAGKTGVSLLRDYGMRSAELGLFLEFVEKKEHLGLGEVHWRSLHRDTVVQLAAAADDTYVQLRRTIYDAKLQDPNSKIEDAKLTQIEGQIAKVYGMLDAIGCVLRA